MDLNRKLELAKSGVTSMATHDDAPIAVRKEGLTLLKTHIDAEIASAEDREKAQIAATFGGQ